MFAQDRFDHRLFGQRLARFRLRASLGLEVIDVKPEHIPVFDGVRDRVGMKALLEQLLGRPHRRLLGFDLLQRRVVVKDRGAGETEELRLGKKLLDRAVVFAELRAVAFVKNEDDPFVLERYELLLVRRLVVLLTLLVPFAVFVQG